MTTREEVQREMVQLFEEAVGDFMAPEVGDGEQGLGPVEVMEKAQALVTEYTRRVKESPSQDRAAKYILGDFVFEIQTLRGRAAPEEVTKRAKKILVGIVEEVDRLRKQVKDLGGVPPVPRGPGPGVDHL